MPTNKTNENKTAPAVSVGQRIRALRHQRGYSLRVLAEQSGLNINTLSLIEKEKTSPSVSTLQHLARALAVPITAFFESDEEKKSVSLLRTAEQNPEEVNGTWVVNLNKEWSGDEIQPFLITLEPGANSGSAPIVHTGYEFAYCLKGRLLYTIEKDVFTLEEGDCLIFEAHLPHHWQNVHDEPAQLLLVLAPTERRAVPSSRHFGQIPPPGHPV